MEPSNKERIEKLGLTEQQIETAEEFLDFRERNELLDILEAGTPLGKLVWDECVDHPDASERCSGFPDWPECECAACNTQSSHGRPHRGCEEPAYATNEVGMPICKDCSDYLVMEDGTLICGSRTCGFTQCPRCAEEISWLAGQNKTRTGTCDCGEAWAYGDERYSYAGDLVEAAICDLDEEGLDYDTEASLAAACAWLRDQGTSQSTIDRVVVRLREN